MDGDLSARVGPGSSVPAPDDDRLQARTSRVLGALPSPMAIVTVHAVDGERSGCLVGFLTQCSIDPPRLLVCISKTNHTHGVAQRSEHLGVAFVPADRHDLAEVFGGLSGDDVDKLALVPWTEGPHGVPLLDGTPAWVVGRILERHDLGDHTGHLVEVVATSGEPEDDPLPMVEAEDIDPGHGA